MSAEPLDPALARLRAALALMEAAIERRRLYDATRADAHEELALMQDDRARLAVELDGALKHNRALLSASAEAGKRFDQAEAAIRAVLANAGPAP